MALPQDNYKQQYGDSLGTSAALNETINTFLTLSMDRQNTGGIYWHYYGGDIRVGNTVTTLAPGTLILTNATNYIEVDKNGTVSFNAVGFSANQIPVAIVTVAGGAITSYIDKRTFLNGDIAVPAGNDKEVQFNDGGVFGADPNFLWDKTLNHFTINGSQYVGTGAHNTNYRFHLSNNSLNEFSRAALFEARTTLTPTAALVSAATLKMITTGDMIDGFGSALLFAIEDSAAVENFIGRISCMRAGADNSGSMTFLTGNAGTLGERMRINPNGDLMLGNTTAGWKLRVAPTANTTAGQTSFIQDATATTGSTKLVIKAGAGQSTNTLEEWQDISANIMASMSQTVFTSPATLQLKNGTKFNSFTNSGSQAAGTLAYTLPAAYPAASGYSLTSTDAGIMSWVDVSGGGATPGGGTTAVQVNVGGAFWGDETQFWHDTSINTLGISLGKVQIQSAGLAGGIDGMSLTYAGSGYTLDDILYVDTTPGSGGYIKVTGVDGGGAVLSFSVYRRGTAYTVSSSIATTGGTGSNCYVNIDSIMDITQPALSMIDVHGTKQVTFNVSDEQTASTNINYILPASYPATSGDVMSCTTDGIMSWITAASGSPFTQDGTTFSIRRTDESTTGNTRGAKAIDLAYERSSAAMVAAGDYSGILSGRNHRNDNKYGVICGGDSNIIEQTELTFPYGEAYYGKSFIGAGYGNQITGKNRLCIIGGGYGNSITSISTTDNSCNIIGGGNQNVIDMTSKVAAYCNTICGGQQNVIVGATHNYLYQQFIGGGINNQIQSGYYNAIVAGQNNLIGGTYGSAGWGFIGGGYDNQLTVSSQYGTIPGGKSNQAGSYSFAAGYNAQANTGGAFCFADGTLTQCGRANQAKFGVDGGFTVRNNSGTFDLYGQTVGGVAMWLTSPNAASYWGADGIWYTPSSRELKTNFVKSDTKDILQKVSIVNIDEWEYKEHQGIKHIGIMAQDFNKLFGYGNTPESLNTMDVCGVLWAAVQELTKQVNELKNKIQ